MPSDGERIGERATWQKRALAAALAESDTFRSAQQIHAQLRESGDKIGLTTVYNQLRAMAASGLVDVLRAEDGEALYRRCSTDEHHHHLLCRCCGRTVEIDAPEVEQWASSIARSRRFSEVSHTLEIVGTCQSCRRAAKA